METFSLATLGLQKTRRVSLLLVGLLACALVSRAQAPPERCASPLIALDVERSLRSIVLETWRRSITFRRQVMRIAREQRLAITVGIWSFAGPGPRAQTSFVRKRGRLARAEVQVKHASTLTTVEFIAHELEHVLEQLDGVDLARMDGRGGVTVSRHEGRAYVETQRAQQVGRIVAEEYQAEQAVVDPCPESAR